MKLFAFALIGLLFGACSTLDNYERSYSVEADGKTVRGSVTIRPLATPKRPQAAAGWLRPLYHEGRVVYPLPPAPAVAGKEVLP